jgi:NIMA-interacting peptidyl-prolyl cis-trans isomerase 1
VDSYRKKPITRSKAEAIANIKSIRERIKDEGEFMKLAGELSECSSAGRGGDLGFFGRGQMQKAFEDVAFSLKVGQISEVVDSDSGIHIILRIE